MNVATAKKRVNQTPQPPPPLCMGLPKEQSKLHKVLLIAGLLIAVEHYSFSTLT